VPPEVDPPAFGNSRYKVTFEQRQPRPDYGMAYRFWLQDAVDDVPEYIVKWELFEALAAEHGLQLVYTSTFGDLFFTAKEDPEFQTLMKRMRVVDEMGQSQLDEEMWDAASQFARPPVRLKLTDSRRLIRLLCIHKGVRGDDRGICCAMHSTRPTRHFTTDSVRKSTAKGREGKAMARGTQVIGSIMQREGGAMGFAFVNRSNVVL
jgi:hypothetical protein